MIYSFRSVSVITWTVLIITLTAIGQETNAAEQACLPYVAVYNVATEVDPLSSTGGVIRIKFSSLLPDVMIKDIDLFIDSKTGRIPLPLAPDGSCAIPYSPELYKENPFLRVNQPKGSMKMVGHVNLRIPIPEDRTLPYRELMRTIDLVQRVKREIQPKEVVSGEYLEDLVIRVQDYGGRNVVIQISGGDVIIQPDEGGIFTVPYRSDWMDINPLVVLPGRDVQMLSLSERGQMRGSNNVPEDTVRKLTDPQH